MMLGDDAVSAMYRLLKKESKRIGINELGVFKYEIPKKSSLTEYVVINHLPFVQQYTINEGIVNVNIHVRRTASDEPNTRRLKTIAKNILVFFKDNTYLDGAYFEFYSDSRPTPDNDNTYYINLKFNVTYNNLKD
uniref:hypothetical protein n=1 Tax=Prevotella sp. TaxID=59823 RepID=UPI0040297990